MTRDEVVAAMAARGLTRVETLGSPAGMPATEWDPYGLATPDWQSAEMARPRRGWQGDIDGFETLDGDGVTKRRFRWRFLP